MLFTVSAKANSFGGLSNIGSKKSLLFWAIELNAQINLVTCQNSEPMAGSQYPQTTRSLLKTGLLLIYYIDIVFVQKIKIIISIEDGSTLSLNSGLLMI